MSDEYDSLSGWKERAEKAEASLIIEKSISGSLRMNLQELRSEKERFKIALAKVGSYFDTHDEQPCGCDFERILDQRQQVAIDAVGMTAWKCLDFVVAANESREADTKAGGG